MFVNCNSDVVFKRVMQEEKILRKVIESIIPLKKDSKIIYGNLELIPYRKKNRKQSVDLLIQNQEMCILIEVNGSGEESVIDRNVMYTCKVASESTLKGEDFVYKKMVLINLNYKSKSETIIEKNIFRNEVNKGLTEIMEIYMVNMDKLKEEYYNKNEKIINKYKYLIMQTLTKEELNNFMKGDEIIDMFNQALVYVNGEAKLIELCSEEEARRLDRNFAFHHGYKGGVKKGLIDGKRQGFEEGLSKGIKLGIEQNTMEMMSKLLENNVDIKTITKVLNIEKEEAKRLLLLLKNKL